MANALTEVETPEEREYIRFMSEVEIRQRRAAELQTELATLKQALSRFEMEYHARVGVLFVELDRARLAVAEYQWRIEQLQHIPAVNLAEVEAEVASAFASRQKEVAAAAEEARRYEHDFSQEQARPQLSADSALELRRLYRDLARRHHPDLARTPIERERRQRIMQRVNAAFQEHDLEALRSLEQEATIEDPTFADRSIGEKLVWAIREVARLDGIIEDLEAEHLMFQASDTHQLWMRQEAGEAVIEALEADARQSLLTEQDHLAELIVTYRQLVEQRTA